MNKRRKGRSKAKRGEKWPGEEKKGDREKGRWKRQEKDDDQEKRKQKARKREEGGQERRKRAKRGEETGPRVGKEDLCERKRKEEARGKRINEEIK